MSRDRRAEWVSYGVLLALWLCQVAANFVWLKVDTRPPYWDMAGHAMQTTQMSRLPFITHTPAAIHGLFTVGDYPPLVYWLSAPLAFFICPTADVLTGINALFLGILILSTYGLARTWGGRLAGLLAAFVVCMYPLIYGLSRHYLLDVPLVAMVALSNWLLIRTNGFERRGATLAYGLSLGLGQLTKWPFALFAAGPFLIAAVRTWKRHSRRLWLNLAGALALAVTVGGPWYLVNLRTLSTFLSLIPVAARAEGDPAVGSLASWGYYLRAFVNQQALLPIALFFVLGLIILLVKRGFRYETVSLLAWIALPYLCCSVLSNKDPRYTLPYLPAAAIITAQGLTLLRPKAVRISALTLLIAYAVFQFVGLSWGLSDRLPQGLLPSHVSMRIGSYTALFYAEYVHLTSPPRTEDWQVQAILDDVVRSGQVRPETRPLKVVVLPNAAWFETTVFRYYAQVDRLPIEAVGVTGLVEVADARERVLASDYVVAKTGDLGPAWTVQQASLFSAELQDPASELGRQFDLIGTYGLPDGSTAELYSHTAWK